MSEKRILTDAEKKHAAKVQMVIERQRFPDHKIDIEVYNETDDHGQPRFVIKKQKETEMPSGWEPSDNA